LDYFKKIQKTYNAFSRLAFLYKYKKAKIIQFQNTIKIQVQKQATTEIQNIDK
jgi:hypothetical protein